METEAVLRETGSAAAGLDQQEAAKRLEERGPNRLKEEKKQSILLKFFKQLADPMIVILLVAAAVSGFTAFYAGESFADVLIILGVVILNSVLGVVQESKAEKSLEALKEMTKAISRVRRGGSVLQVKSEDLVVGDVILLEAGDAVPADARLLEVASLQVEEAALTGESLPVTKTSGALADEGAPVPLGDRKNMVYTGSTVVYGRGEAVVTATGMETEMGKIAAALTAAKEEKTPLQRKLAQLSKVLTGAVTLDEVRQALQSYSYSVCYDVTAKPGTAGKGGAEDV